MKISSLVLLTAFFFCWGCDTSNNVEPRYEDYFIKYFGTQGDQYGADIVVNADGTMVLLGNSNALSGFVTPFLVKVDPRGNILWEQSFGENENAVDIELIRRGPNQGNLIVASNVTKGNLTKIRLWRLSQEGSIIDSVTLNNSVLSPYSQSVKSVTSLTSSDGYVVTGSADGSLMVETSPEISEAVDRDILAFHVNESFTAIENVVSKGGELNGSGIKVLEMPHNPVGQLVLFSYTDRPFLSNDFGFNFSYDIVSSGVPVGNIIGTADGREILSCVIKTPSNLGEGFLMAGTSSTNGGTRSDIYLVKFNTTFEFKGLDKRIDLGRNVECVAADNAPNGYYILSNEIIDVNRKNILLIKVSADGEAEWVKTFGTFDADDTGSAITVLEDGRIAIVATLQLKTRKKLALIVVNSKGDF